MKRRLTTMLAATSLALGLAHCADEAVRDEAVRDEAELAQTARAVDAGAQAPAASLDAGTIATPPASDAGTTFTITSSVVKDKEMIPKDYRCNMPSPPLAWTSGPAGTKSYALVFRDKGNGFYHWVIWDLPPTTTGLPQGVPLGLTLTTPIAARQSPNWSGREGYGGPCAPGAAVSNYGFTLYALDVAQLPGITGRPAAAQVAAAIEQHALAKTLLSIQSVR